MLLDHLSHIVTLSHHLKTRKRIPFSARQYTSFLHKHKAPHRNYPQQQKRDAFIPASCFLINSCQNQTHLSAGVWEKACTRPGCEASANCNSRSIAIRALAAAFLVCQCTRMCTTNLSAFQLYSVALYFLHIPSLLGMFSLVGTPSFRHAVLATILTTAVVLPQQLPILPTPPFPPFAKIP